MNLKLSVRTALIIYQLTMKINMEDLEEIQIEIKKELGGASLNHLLGWCANQIRFYESINMIIDFKFCYSLVNQNFDGKQRIYFNLYSIKNGDIFRKNFVLLNDQNQALNIFGQSEEFQKKLYEAIQIIKNINNK